MDFKDIRGMSDDHDSTRTDEIRPERIRIDTTISERLPNYQYLIFHLEQMRILYLTNISIVMFDDSEDTNSR